MKQQLKYAASVDEKGKLTVGQANTFKLDILANFTGKNVWVIVEERTNKPSKSQFGYLFGVVIPRYKQALLREQGYVFTIKETEHFIEETFLQEQRINTAGEPYVVTKSIGDLRKPEIAKLIDILIINAATELNEIIPFADEQYKDKNP